MSGAHSGQGDSKPTTAEVYSFDAGICVEAESEEAAVNLILDHCVGEPAHIAISLHKEGSLNHAKLEAAKQTITRLKAEKVALVKVETLAMLLCNEYFRSTSDIGPSMEKLYELLKQE